MVESIAPKRLGVNLNRCTAVAEHDLGETFYGRNGRVYRYVQFRDAVAYAVGHVVTLASNTQAWQVTNDRVGGSSLAAHIPVGVVFQTPVPTQNQFGWVQVTGIAQVLHQGAAIVTGDLLVADPTVDGAASEADYAAIAHLDFLHVGVALATTGSGVLGPVLLRIGE